MPMTTWLLTLSVAQAGTAVWLSGTPDPTLTPDDKARRAEKVAPVPAFDADDEAAVQALTAELRACGPLLDEFDGELDIIRRLGPRIAAVEVIRPDDRDLVWKALLLEGLAVHRYFPELSAPEAGTAGVARTLGGATENAAWADAIALAPDRLPDIAELGEESARLAFQEQRARLLLLDTGTVAVSGAPEGAAVHVDGQLAPGGKQVVVPGTHRYTVQLGATVVARGMVLVAPGATEDAPYAAVVDEMKALEPTLLTAREAVVLPPAVVVRLESLEAPVSLVVVGKRGPKVFRVDGENAILAKQDAPSSSPDGPHVWVMGAAGLTYDANFFTHNFFDGAPDSPGTVNALSPVVGAGAQMPVGPVHLGVGTDLVIPLGEWSTLPTDDTTLRLRAHPHLGVGYGPVQLTAGFWAPWHLGLGARATVPIADSWAVTGAIVQGMGLTWSNLDGSDFSPEASRVGWVGMAWLWPR